MVHGEITVIHLLRELVLAVEGLERVTVRSWGEVWGAPVISAFTTALGWFVILWVYHNSNRNMVRLQMKERARTAVLDALDEYAQYLRDLRFPKMALQRSGAIHWTPPSSNPWIGATGSVEAHIDCAAAKGIITSLTLFDSRERHWRLTLDHAAWLYDKDAEISQKVCELEKAHNTIMSDQTTFYSEVALKIESGEAAVSNFLERGRDSESEKRIDEQYRRIDDVRDKLSAPGFAPISGRVATRQKPD